MKKSKYLRKRLDSYYDERGFPLVNQTEIRFIENEILRLMTSGHDGIINDWRDWSKVTYINKWFKGCHRHHITETIVVCIPGELHKHIKHNLKTGYNMGEINMLALQFINGKL